MNDSPLQPFRELAEALRQRLATIRDTIARDQDPAAHLQRLQQASEAIQECHRRLPPPVDPHLAHYLERCSYDKALSWIEQKLEAE